MFRGLPVVAAAASYILQQQTTPDVPPQAGQITIGVLIAVYVAKEIIELLIPLFKKEKGHKNDTVDQLCQQVRDLHQWHSVKDPTGIPIWYRDSQTSRQTALLEEVRDLLKEAQVASRQSRTPRQ